MNISKVPSPCVSICQLSENASGERSCVGCLRTVDEIVQWATSTDQQKRAILMAIEERKDARKGAE